MSTTNLANILPETELFMRFSQSSNLSSKWSTTALLGVGYKVNRVDLASPNLNRKTLAALTLANEETSAFLVGNAVRWDLAMEGANNTIVANRVSLVRNEGAAATASFGFAANAVVSLALTGKRLEEAIEKGDTTGVAIASVSIAAESLSFGANFLNGLTSIRTIKGTGISGNVKGLGLGIAGSVLGLAQGVSSVASLAPLLADKNLTDEQKKVIAAEISTQLLGGLVQAGSNIALAVNVAKGLTTGAAVVGPALGAAAGALVVAMSPLEIYGLVKQSQYADKLEELGKEMSQFGYDGDSMLASLYRDKTKAEGGILAATMTLSIIGSAVAIASAATGVGAPVAAIVGLVTGIVSGILKGVTQPIIEKIATDYAQKIQDQGGSFAYFAKNLLARHDQLISSVAVSDYLKDLQVGYGVDSVAAVSSIKLSTTAMELAAITRTPDQLKSADSYIDRFVDGKVVADRTLKLDPVVGTIDLSGSAGTKQLLTFLSPLMAPGEEKRARVSTGKNSYLTSLEVVMSSTGWTITDGDASSIMDLRQVVTRLTNSAGTVLKSVDLNVSGGAGNDTVLANASNLNFDGGLGNDSISYDGPTDARIIVVPTATGFQVIKNLWNVESYQETTGSTTYNYGKRSETVQYRDVELKKLGDLTGIDTLTNVENIMGGSGNDNIMGNGAANRFAGNGGNDVIDGAGGNDQISGGAGMDTLKGGAGNDFFSQELDSDGDNIDGGDGIDTVDYSGVTMNLGDPQSTVDLGIAVDLTKNSVRKGTGQVFDTIRNVENVIGTARNDQIIGDANNNMLAGGVGNDSISGGAGNDAISGGAGNDALYGGDGNDTFVQDTDGTNDTINGGAGTDTLDYSAVGMGGKIDADLATGEARKVLNGTSVAVGGTGRYIRIYHTNGGADSGQVLGLSGLKVYAGGVDVAAGRASKVGTDRGGEFWGQEANNDWALTDSSVGGAWTEGRLAYVQGYGAYIELDLGSSQSIDSLALWGQTEFNDHNNLRIYVSDTPFGTAKTAYADLEANPNVKRFDVARVDGAASSTFTDSLTGIENLVGASLDDTLSGDGSANVLSGDAGNDRLNGRDGDDLLLGGAGNDTVNGDNGDDTLAGGLGADTLYGDGGDDLFVQDMERATDTLIGGAGSDTVDYSSAGMAGSLQANLTTGQVTKVLSGTSVAVGGTGRYIRIYHTNGGANSDQVLGLSGLKVYAGGVDVAAGRASKVYTDDGGYFRGQGANNDYALTDSSVGGAWREGNLAYVQGAGAYIELDLGSSHSIDSLALWGQTEFNDHNNLRIYVSDTPFGTAKTAYADLEANLNVKKFDVARVDGTATSTFTDSLAGIENLVGASFNDVLTGDANANTLSGVGGNDVLTGNAGDDYLDGGAGNDTLEGGAGDDLLLGGEGNDSINAGAGNDVVRQNIAAYVPAAGANVSIKMDTLVGGEGIDALDYSKTTYNDGSRAVMGEIGIVADLAAGKVKTYYGSIEATTYEVYDSISQFENVIGTTLNDSLTGDANDNMLAGDKGNDSLNGADGDDFLLGGAGNDSIIGGNGSDTLSGDAGSDTLDAGLGNDTILQTIEMGIDTISGGLGVDTVDYSVTHLVGMSTVGIQANLGTGQVTKTLAGTSAEVGMQGRYIRIYHTNAGAQGLALTGLKVFAGGIDVAAGKASRTGADSGSASGQFYNNDRALTDASVGGDWNGGTSGNLAYVGGQGAYIELDLGGSHSIDSLALWGQNGWEDHKNLRVYVSDTPFGTASTAYADLAVNPAVKVIDLTTVETTAVTTSTDTLSGVENLIGTSLSDTLTGDANANSLVGGAGNDTVTGHGGNDALAGGTGADIVNGGDGDDMIVQDMDRSNDQLIGGAGNDVVDYSVTENAGSINANLSTGTVTKTLTGTSVVIGLTGRFIRIYHNDAMPTLSLTGLKVFSNGVNVASGRASTIGADKDGSTSNIYNNPAALTDANVGGTWNGQSTSGASNLTYAYGTRPYIELDLGSSQSIDSLALWGRADGTSESNNLRIFVSDKPFASSATAYADLSADPASNRIDLATVSTAASSQATDTLSGVEGLVGTTGNDTLVGDAIANLLNGGAGNDTISGGAGEDMVVGSSGDDVLNGEAGNDTLSGGVGKDTVNGGDGNDLLLQNIDASADTLDGGNGIDTVDYSLTDVSGMTTTGVNVDLIAGTAAKGLVGTTAAASADRLLNIENVIGTNLADTIKGNALANTLTGGKGDDTLIGAAGNDTYLFARGDGKDKVLETDTTAGNSDALCFGPDIAESQIWFRKVNGNHDLEVSVIGTSDSITIAGWYDDGSSHHLERLFASTGKQLLDSKVDALVSAMAAFSPPSAGQTTLTGAMATALQPVIASNWASA